MTRFDPIVVIHSHDDLQKLHSAASAASTSLALDVENADARDQWTTGLGFVQAALDHMREEESGVFVAAERDGMPATIMELLRLEHARLAVLGAQLMRRAQPDDEGALLLIRFLQRFEDHVADEEWGLTWRGRVSP